ncbi:hypothetical protein HG530_005865 [Fusarium avenaceum]|nr:hypothetical protein HG530_005865 [Fusarium avenaceum]
MAGSRHDPVDLGSDKDEDEALSYAIALSLQEQEVQDEQSSQIPSAPILNSRRNGTGSSGAGLSLLSFDRKKMEEERLQRLAKRRRSPTDDEDMAQVPPAKRMTPSEPSRTVAGFSPPSLLPYPNGAIKRTWAKGYPRTSEDIKIEEVLQKDKLELALLSSYQWDDEWLMSKFDLRKTKLLLLAFADNEAQKSEMRSNAPPGIKFVFPAMNGPGAMHSKLQLLKYPDYLRVVVPTANLVPYDWGETGVMENMVFLIDLPRLEDSALYQPTIFSTELGRFLSATGVGESMINSLGNYDFSRTKHLRFVYTIPGGHQGDSLKRIGYSGLGTSVASLGLATDDPIDVDFVCASLGSLNYDLVGAIYNACQGDDGLDEYKSRTGRAGTTKNKVSNPWKEKLKDRFRIYFPTDETVGKSRGGRNQDDLGVTYPDTDASGKSIANASADASGAAATRPRADQDFRGAESGRDISWLGLRRQRKSVRERMQGKKRAPTASATVRLCSALLATSSGYFENDWDAIVMIFSNLMLTVAAMVRRTGAALSRTERQDSLK